MKKKIITIILIAVTIFYIIIGALLLTNIQLLDAPEILVEVGIKDFNSETAVLHTIINIDNTNGFDLIARNIELVTITPEGYEVIRTLIEGGTIRANENKTFTEDVAIEFNGNTPEHLTTEITGEVGVNILFIQKTIPIKVGVITDFENLLNDITLPSITISTSITDITTERVNLTAEASVYNPNSFEIIVGNISADIETDSREKVGNLEIMGGIIPSKDYLELNGSGYLLFKALNSKKLVIDMKGEVGVRAAGFEKSLPLDITATINIPDLEGFLLPKDNPTVLSIKADRKITLQGFINEVTLEVNNTFKVDLVLRDTHVKMFMIADDIPQLLAENAIEGELLCPAGKASIFTTDVNFGFAKLFTVNLNADWLLITVSANLTIRGLDSAVYLELNGYQDTHIIT